MDLLDVARLLRFQTDWERRFHHYNLLLDAGIEAEEAERIAALAAEDRAAETRREAA
jgi:hypothetical protein